MTDGQVDAAKAGGAWTVTGLAMWLESIGIQNWGDLAAMLAAMYSVLLIAEWFWKRFRRNKERCDEDA